MNGNRRTIAASLLTVCFALVFRLETASAQDHKEFRDAYTLGLEHYDQREYAKAREEFVKAYTIRPEPLILFNVAQCYRHERAFQNAQTYYKRYLKTSPPDPIPRDEADLRDKAATYLEEMSAELAAEDQATGEQATGEQAAGEQAAKKRAEAALVAGTGSPHERPGARKRTAAWISFGVAGAGLIGTLTLGALAFQAESNKNENPTQGNADRVNRYENLTNVAFFLTGAAATTGLTLWLLSRSEDRAESAKSPALLFGVGFTTDGAAASVRLSF